jgi:chromosome segregation ATPase
MTQKTVQSAVEDCKVIQKNIDTLTSETTNLKNLIDQHQNQLFELQSQRDELEASQQSAPDLLVSGELSKEQFSQNKKTLADLYSLIDETQSLLEIFERKLQGDYPKRQSDLMNNLSARKRLLQTLLAEKLAADIAEKSGQQIKELLALLPGARGDNRIGYDPLLDVGLWLGMAVFGGHYDSPKRQNPKEERQIVGEIYTGIGL